MTEPTTILDRIAAFIQRFVALPSDDYATILATYVLHTHCFDSAEATPYLYITSAGPQSGKSTTLDVLTELVRNPMKAGSISGAAMYKAIESTRPTIMFDEADTIFTGAANEALRGLLNDGYKRGGCVYRSVPGQEEPVAFNVFGPKLMAGINNGHMPETIKDRSIILTLKRADARIERFIPRRIREDIDTLRADIDAWVAENQDKVADNLPKDIDSIPPRAFEIAEPLLQVASQVRGWTPKVRAAVERLLAREVPPLGINAQALQHAHRIMEEQDRDFVFSAEIADAMDITGKRIGVLMAAFDIKPKTINRAGFKAAKGYHRADIMPAVEKNLS